MLSPFMCCAAVSFRCHLSGGIVFRPFRYGFSPRGRAGFWQKILTALCTLMFFYLLPAIFAPVPVHRLRCHSRPTLVLSCASHPLSGALRGSPHGKQGQKSAADLRKVPFLPPSAQSCGQNPKRISHRYRQLRAK